jgi:hypothetical protein
MERGFFQNNIQWFWKWACDMESVKDTELWCQMEQLQGFRVQIH